MVNGHARRAKVGDSRGIGVVGAAASCSYVPPRDAEHLGEAWYVKKGGFIVNPDGFRTATLYRKQDRQFIPVDAGLTEWRYYPPDCVLYRSVSLLRWELGARLPGDFPEQVGGIALAVCGGQSPVPLELDDGNTRDAYIDTGYRGSGGLVPLDRIKRLARQQPPFARDWREKVVLKDRPFEGLDRQ